MIELFPAVFGISLGFVWMDRRRHTMPWIVMTFAMAIGAIVATWTSGEFAISWMFLAVDFAIVAGGALAGAILSAYLSRSQTL